MIRGHPSGRRWSVAGRRVVRAVRWLGFVVAVAVSGPASVWAQGAPGGAGAGRLSTDTVPPPRNLLLLQRIEDVLIGVDRVSIQVIDRHHVAASYVRVHAGNPQPLLGLARVRVDCRIPLRMAVLASSTLTGHLGPDGRHEYRVFEADGPLADEHYGAVHLLNGTQFVAEFACRASAQPSRGAQFAAELLARGGPADQQTLRCTLLPDGQPGPAQRAEVRFSVAAQAVAVNRQWLLSGAVSEREVMFGSGPSEWRIDREALRARLVNDVGHVEFEGDCQRD